jgi:uncharacterized zinc-type alcohol dehydrogenase-like protein
MVCHNTKHDGVLKKLDASLDLIISTINVPLDIPGLLDTLAPNGKLHVVEAILEPMQMPAFGLIMRQKSIAGSPTESHDESPIVLVLLVVPIFSLQND